MKYQILLTDNEFFYAWYEQMKPQLKEMYFKAIKTDPIIVGIPFSEFCADIYDSDINIFILMN
jgi:hypothetical protein